MTADVLEYVIALGVCRHLNVAELTLDGVRRYPPHPDAGADPATVLRWLRECEGIAKQRRDRSPWWRDASAALEWAAVLGWLERYEAQQRAEQPPG